MQHSPDVHLGYHLGGEEQRDGRVREEGDVLQRRIPLEGLGRVQRDGGERDEGTESHQAAHPQLVHPLDVGALVQRLLRAVVGEEGFAALEALLAAQHYLVPNPGGNAQSDGWHSGDGGTAHGAANPAADPHTGCSCSATHAAQAADTAEQIETATAANAHANANSARGAAQPQAGAIVVATGRGRSRGGGGARLLRLLLLLRRLHAEGDAAAASAAAARVHNGRGTVERTGRILASSQPVARTAARRGIEAELAGRRRLSVGHVERMRRLQRMRLVVLVGLMVAQRGMMVAVVMPVRVLVVLLMMVLLLRGQAVAAGRAGAGRCRRVDAARRVGGVRVMVAHGSALNARS